jgi:hypothetical protein
MSDRTLRKTRGFFSFRAFLFYKLGKPATLAKNAATLGKVNATNDTP